MNWEQLIKIIRQQATQKEQEQFDAWVNASTENKALYEALVQRQQLLSQVVDDALVQGAWEKMVPRLGNRIPKTNRVSHNLFKYAAAAIVLVAVVAGWWLLQSRSQKSVSPVPHWVIAIAGSREKKKVIQPVYSVVWMQYYSTLQYDSIGFNDTSRLLMLNGEAFFEVANAPEKPFRVQTPHLKITVLGTSFNIAARNNSPQEVTVATGKVKVAGNYVNEILLPAQSVTYDPSTGNLKTGRISLLAATAVKDNQLVFEKDDIGAIAAKMGKWYNRQVIVKGTVRRKISFTGTIKDTGLEDVLEGLGYLAGFTYKIDTTSITIYPDK